MDQPPSRKRKAASKAKPRDTMLIHGVSEDGEKLAVLRAREDRVEAGVISKAKEGEPLNGELVKLTPHADCPLICDVDVQFTPPSKLGHGGPAQVASESYRANWDAIWSKKKKTLQLN